ncbi:MAG: Xanthine and CO dehydrogenases maturation factor, XdhC/CoxF family, partial [uncultured Gemmatimonadaceae bacterium]
MADIGWVAATLADVAARGGAMVLATVVRTEGSTYRRAGARMLVAADGRTVGAVSGGCLEADLALHARDALAAGAAALVTYDSRADEDLVWGLGLGCDGRVDVLLEPLASGSLAAATALYTRCLELDAPATLATVIAVSAPAPAGAPRPGDRLLVRDAAAEAAGLRADAVPAA